MHVCGWSYGLHAMYACVRWRAVQHRVLLRCSLVHTIVLLYTARMLALGAWLPSIGTTDRLEL